MIAVPAGRDLGPDELRALALELADRPELWRSLVRHDPKRRLFTRLWADEHVTAWLICWMAGHDTGFHDHDGSSGAAGVVEGAVREDRLRLTGPPVSRTLRAGAVFAFGLGDIHRVAHAGSGPAVTVHAYSPPLRNMGAYVEAPRGAMQRLIVADHEELRPLTAPLAGAQTL